VTEKDAEPIKPVSYQLMLTVSHERCKGLCNMQWLNLLKIKPLHNA